MILFINKVIRKIVLLILSLPSHIKRLYLKKIYLERSGEKGAINFLDKKDEIDFSFAHDLRQKALVENKLKHQSKPYKILFYLPESGVGIVWFKDLMQILEYSGIACTTVSFNDQAFKSIWNEFQPNVFISIDTPKNLRTLDLDFICKYKQEHGCLRLYTPYPSYHFPKQGMSKEDKWRFDLALAGKTADAYFCMFVDEYWTLAQSEWDQAGFKYLSLPHGCNPIYQYPRIGQKKYDYFMATSYGTERVRVTWDYMKPIFEKYNGLWAGPDWGFGLGYIDAQQLPQYYAESKIVPNPLASKLIKYPMEITERTFSAMANGAFQITDRTPVTTRFFEEDELIQVNGKEEFVEKFEYYISHEDERRTVLENGMKRLYQDHTYFHRIDRLITFVDQQQVFIDHFPLK